MKPALYTSTQRWVALVYGIAAHSFFLGSVLVMFWSLYHGLNLHFLQLHGVPAALMDLLLLGQFAIGHSLLLSDRGRRLMARMAPLNLGVPLSTTIFASIASVQLLATFLLWSASGSVWWIPEGGTKVLLSVFYVIAWALLAKSMHDAGLDAQIGALGWRAVWRGQNPVHKPFARTGMFRYSRQPIYASFALILWTAPVWTPDHLLVAILWTLYCVLAPVLKEQRYRRWYGSAFERYRSRVPYWWPGKTKALGISNAATDYDVAIVGAGPVGLLLAGLLGSEGLRVLAVDKRRETLAHSQAIGITPPSLEILERLGLSRQFVDAGLKIRECHVHGQTGYLGTASFRDIPGEHRYILSLPQQQTLDFLEDKVASFPSVTLRKEEITALEQQDGMVAFRGDDFGGTARWVVGCDGHRSMVRQSLKMRTSGAYYGTHFLMGDFADHTELGEDGHLWFTKDGAVEAFPLPHGRRRWIVQTAEAMPEAPLGTISELVARRAGIGLSVNDQLNQSLFSPRWLQAEQYHDGRVLLCGDAAHLMSPIGGQGMNTGWADAEFLAAALVAIERRGQAATPLLEAYDRIRRRAADVAIARAARGMWLGTRTGGWQARLRDFFIRECMFKGLLAKRVGPYFAMLTIPCGTVKRTPATIWSPGAV